MKLLSVTMGVSRIEFSVEMHHGKFVGKVNDTVIAEGPDFQAVREATLKGIESGPMSKEIH